MSRRDKSRMSTSPQTVLDLTADLHCHTAYCNHAQGRMEEYVEAALERGLREIGFLEHAETGIDYDHRIWLTEEMLDQYWEEGNRLRSLYRDRIVVSVGIELGVNPSRVEASRQLRRRHPWDRIGLSYHFYWDGASGRHLNISSPKPGNLALLRELDPEALVTHYYEVLIAHLPLFLPDLICHLDVVRRNLPPLDHRPGIQSLIRQLLSAMRAAGTALEINTSGYEYTGHFYPSGWIVEEALRQGIPLVPSSDSHHPTQVGRHFDRAATEIVRILESRDSTAGLGRPD